MGYTIIHHGYTIQYIDIYIYIGDDPDNHNPWTAKSALHQPVFEGATLWLLNTAHRGWTSTDQLVFIFDVPRKKTTCWFIVQICPNCIGLLYTTGRAFAGSRSTWTCRVTCRKTWKDCFPTNIPLRITKNPYIQSAVWSIISIVWLLKTEYKKSLRFIHGLSSYQAFPMVFPCFHGHKPGQTGPLSWAPRLLCGRACFADVDGLKFRRKSMVNISVDS